MSDACASYSTLEQLNEAVHPYLHSITQDTDFFSHYRLSLFSKKCPFWRTRMPKIDWTMITFLSGSVAISGNGGSDEYPHQQLHPRSGLGNGETRGDHSQRFRRPEHPVVACRHRVPRHRGSLAPLERWYRHVVRDQVALWMPACFFGLAFRACCRSNSLDADRRSAAAGWPPASRRERSATGSLARWAT